MNHEIAPKNTYLSPLLEKRMLEKGVYFTGYNPERIDELTDKLNVPRIENKTVLLRTADGKDKYKLDEYKSLLTVSLSLKDLDPLSPQRLTRAFGRSILQDPNLNPDLRWPLNRKQQAIRWGTVALASIPPIWYATESIPEEGLALAPVMFAGAGAGIVTVAFAGWIAESLVVPGYKDVRDWVRVGNAGRKVDSPLTLQST